MSLTWLQTSQQKGPEESAYRCDVHLDAMGAVAVSWQFSKGRGIEEWSQSFEKMTFARNITKNQQLFAPNTTSKNEKQSQPCHYDSHFLSKMIAFYPLKGGMIGVPCGHMVPKLGVGVSFEPWTIYFFTSLVIFWQ